MKSMRVLGQRVSCPLMRMEIMALVVATSATLPLCAGTAGVEGLARRVVGDKAERFAFVLDENRSSEKEYFVLSSREDGKIVVKANTVSAQCAGLGWYLRHVAKVQVFWEGVSRIPETLPPVTKEIRKEAPYRYRVAFNYCAHSYSLAFADKARWEREIDILALHGVNLLLAITGIECVWYETLLSLGWSDEEVRAFIVGPAFMAWQWMTNIESYGGPIPKSWLDSHLELGRFIIGRELELGMKPIQQGFTGNVPRSIAKKYPNADVKLQPKWCGFTGSAQLDPTDPLFPQFAQTFYAAQKRLFGAYGFYATDPFHESAPPKKGEKYLEDVGRIIGAELVKADPNACACIMSWSIRMPILRQFPKDHALVLDISGGRARGTKGFDGYPFSTGLIRNFGGRTDSGGSIPGLAKNGFAATRAKYPNCVGAGFFPEGIHTSPLYFALSLDLLWRSDSPNPTDWLAELLEARYGAPAVEVRPLAQKYLSTFYGNAAGRLTSSLIPSRPTLLPKKSDPNNVFNLNYDSSVLVGLWSDLVSLAERHGVTPGLRYDLVDVGHLALANASYALYAGVLDAFNAHDRAKFDAAAAAFMRLAEDEDALLACEPLLRHDTYLDLARAWGGNAAEKDLYAFNERLQITQWGPFGRPSIFEYAWKEWHGLISEYYLPRWKMFFDHAGKALDGQVSINELFPSVDRWGRPRYKANDLYEKMAAFEEKWISASESGCAAKRRLGDAVAESRKMISKYGEVFGKAFASNPLARMRDRMEALETIYRANIKTKGGKSKP